MARACTRHRVDGLLDTLLADYEHSGIPYDPAATRIDRLEEALQIVKSCFSGKAFSFEGKHYTIKDFEGAPVPV